MDEQPRSPLFQRVVFVLWGYFQWVTWLFFPIRYLDTTEFHSVMYKASDVLHPEPRGGCPSQQLHDFGGLRVEEDHLPPSVSSKRAHPKLVAGLGRQQKRNETKGEASRGGERSYRRGPEQVFQSPLFQHTRRKRYLPTHGRVSWLISKVLN